MKLTYPDIDTVFCFNECTFPALVIENPALFHRITDDLYRQTCGKAGEAILSVNDEPIPIVGNLELITNYFPFEINRKNLLNKIVSKLEKLALSPEFYGNTQHLLGMIEKWISDLAFHNDLELDISRLSVSSTLKSVGICLKEDELPLIEKISTYMDLMTANGLASVFVFVNLRSYLDSRTIEMFTEDCHCHNYNILLIDNREYPKLPNEERTVVDIDLCEF